MLFCSAFTFTSPFTLLLANSQRAQSMSQTSSRASLPRSAPRVASCLAAPLEIRIVFSQVRMSSSGTETARCCSSVSTGYTSASKNRPPISPTAPSDMSSSSIRVSRKLPSNSVVDVDTAPTPKIITSARRPASSVRDITESLRIDATVEGSAYSGAGSRIVFGPQHVRAAAEDVLGTGLVGGGRHRTVELDHRAASSPRPASAPPPRPGVCAPR